MSENAKLARRFFDAIERRAYDEMLDDIYAKDARIWHNVDDIHQTPEENVAEIRRVADLVVKWTYDLTKRIDYDGGFVQQFIPNLTLQDGRTFKLYVCGIFTVADGKIARLEEYYDLMSLQALADAAGETIAA